MMLLAAAATAFTACNKEVDTTKTGETTIRFSATVNDAETRATLTTEDEKTFKAAWETTDKMDVVITGAGEFNATAEWKGSAYEFTIPEPFLGKFGNWYYTGYYPSASVPFGNNRVQKGDAYASEYDVMYGYKEVKDNVCGMNEDGSQLEIPMTRMSSILYFHLSSALNEALASATLTVEEGTIAAETVSCVTGNLIPESGAATYNTITLTFPEGNAPSANDFRLWYNILPGATKGLTLKVTTVSGKTATLSNANGKTYVAGKVNKVVKSGLTWSEGEKYYVKVAKESDLMNGTYLIVNEGFSVAFNGGLKTLDAASNTIEVVIKDGKIQSSETNNAAAFTISIDKGSILSASNLYIGAASYANGLATNTESEYLNDISIDEEGNAVISVSFEDGEVTLRYNKNSDQQRFRYYKSGQQPIALYLLEGSGTEPKPAAQLSFPEEECEITLGDSFTGLTLTTVPTGLDITWSSSNEAVATVDETGKVTAIAPGTTTITAVFSGNDSYSKATASYVLKVNSGVDNGDGSLSHPFNVAGVKEYINNSGADEVYVKGIISRIDEGKEFSEGYGTAIFWISDDGKLDSDQFEAYSVYFLGNRSWKEENTQIKLGDSVILYGKVISFNGTYETSSKEAYLYSLNGNTEILDVPVVEISDNGLDITVSWGTVTGATSYLVVCGDQSYTASSTENSKTFTMPAYDTYKVHVVAKADGIEPGVSNKESVTLSDSSSTTVVFDANTTGLTTTAGHQTATLKNATIEITNGVGDQQIRIYKNAKITVSVPEEFKITEIVFTCTANGETKYGPGCFGETEGYSYEANVGTWAGSSSSVEFTAESNQVRATSIKVTYDKSE